MTFARFFFLYLFSGFFILAGMNHFYMPGIYANLIPPNLPQHEFLVYFTGIAEMCGGILLLFNKTRKQGAILIIVLLILFIPAHIYMIRMAPFHLGKLIITPLIAWLRLPLQALLILWAYQYNRFK
jgi:uncharacterized membrane protein